MLALNHLGWRRRRFRSSSLGMARFQTKRFRPDFLGMRGSFCLACFFVGLIAFFGLGGFAVVTPKRADLLPSALRKSSRCRPRAYLEESSG